MRKKSKFGGFRADEATLEVMPTEARGSNNNIMSSSLMGGLKNVLGKTEPLVIQGPIEDELISDFFLVLQKIIRKRREQNNPKPIKVIINSPGGAAMVGQTLAMYMAASPVPIYTYCVGMCASAASMLFLGGHKRYIYPGSWLMFHDAWMFSYASDGEDHRRQADWHEKLDEEAVDFIHARTGLDKTLIKDECSKDNWWISSSDAVKQGFATHLGDE